MSSMTIKSIERFPFHRPIGASHGASTADKADPAEVANLRRLANLPAGPAPGMSYLIRANTSRGGDVSFRAEDEHLRDAKKFKALVEQKTGLAYLDENEIARKLPDLQKQAEQLP
jgi:hypothetical protein